MNFAQYLLRPVAPLFSEAEASRIAASRRSVRHYPRTNASDRPKRPLREGQNHHSTRLVEERDARVQQMFDLLKGGATLDSVTSTMKIRRKVLRHYVNILEDRGSITVLRRRPGLIIKLKEAAEEKQNAAD